MDNRKNNETIDSDEDIADVKKLGVRDIEKLQGGSGWCKDCSSETGDGWKSYAEHKNDASLQ